MRLEVEGVEVAYGHTQVLFGVDLDVPGDGAVVCLMGRNGVGKTTLLNAVMGLLPVGRGRILLDGVDLRRMPPYERARRGLGYVPQGPPGVPAPDHRENLDVVAERRGPCRLVGDRRGARRVPRAARPPDRPAGLLSGGQAQQLAIARTLTTRPRLLILDEPTEGIQPSIIMEIEDAIARLHARDRDGDPPRRAVRRVPRRASPIATR